MTNNIYSYTGWDCRRERYIVSEYHGWASSFNREHYFRTYNEALSFLAKMNK